MAHERSIVIYITHTKGRHFHQKVETYFKCCPSISIGLQGFHIFAHKFSLTRFFPKQGVNFNFLRQKNFDKIRPIISYKRHNVVNTHTKSAQIVLRSSQKNTTRSPSASFRTIVRRYLKYTWLVFRRFCIYFWLISRHFGDISNFDFTIF